MLSAMKHVSQSSQHCSNSCLCCSGVCCNSLPRQLLAAASSSSMLDRCAIVTGMLCKYGQPSCAVVVLRRPTAALCAWTSSSLRSPWCQRVPRISSARYDTLLLVTAVAQCLQQLRTVYEGLRPAMCYLWYAVIITKTVVLQPRLKQRG